VLLFDVVIVVGCIAVVGCVGFDGVVVGLISLRLCVFGVIVAYFCCHCCCFFSFL